MKFKHRSIMGAIYCCLLAIPMVSVLARVIYVQSNKNAYQSYSGTTTQPQEIPLYQTNELANEDDFILNNIYTVDLETTNDKDINTQWYIIIDCKYLKIEWADTMYECTNNIQFTYYFSSHDIDNEMYIEIDMNGVLLEIADIQEETYFIFVYEDINTFTLDNTNYFSNIFHETNEELIPKTIRDIETNSTLDNVFDYSLSKFVSDNDFGKLNLFSWFYDIFLTEGNNNALYIHFVNWYMNYTLLVSSTYILFLVLMWFINFSRRILERGMNYDW